MHCPCCGKEIVVYLLPVSPVPDATATPPYPHWPTYNPFPGYSPTFTTAGDGSCCEGAPIVTKEGAD